MTKIEWCRGEDGAEGKTWNPVTWCTKVSAGCKNCYAEGVANRFWGDRKFTDVRTHADRLDEPLRWRKPRRVFVNSMSDLFHEYVPDEFIDRVFAVMSLAPQHTFQVLTKRPRRMREYVRSRTAEQCLLAADEGRARGVMAEEPRLSFFARALLGSINGGVSKRDWPLPNVWLGVSCEDQKSADERIPLLLRTPAAVRFLSCEPLIGPVDLAGWGAAIVADDFHAAQPATWDGYQWPEWVPAEERRQIEKFWSVQDGRGPRGWIENQRTNRTPASGARVGVTLANGGWGTVVPALSPLAVKRGRWLHSWNNVGRVITDDGETICASAGFGPSWLERWLQADGKYRHQLHWVIAGGESGPGARPCDVAWIRSIVEQCKAAGVAAFVKQLGARPHGSDAMKAHADRNQRLATPRHGPATQQDADDLHELIAAAGMRLSDRKGGDPSEWPSDLRVREFPEVRP
jgi:protein gp37